MLNITRQYRDSSFCPLPLGVPKHTQPFSSVSLTVTHKLFPSPFTLIYTQRQPATSAALIGTN